MNRNHRVTWRSATYDITTGLPWSPPALPFVGAAKSISSRLDDRSADSRGTFPEFHAIAAKFTTWHPACRGQAHVEGRSSLPIDPPSRESVSLSE
jgi:hypothetical protein